MIWNNYSLAQCLAPLLRQNIDKKGLGGLESLEAFNKNNIPIKAIKVSIDSRTLKPGEIFIAIKGQNYDGHSFIKDAVSKGASAIIASYENYKLALDSLGPESNADIGAFIKASIIPIIFVTDTLLALQKMASFFIKEVQPKVIGITGSNGKTTVKNMAVGLLQNYGLTGGTLGNFNNHIGLPLTILNSNPKSKYLVLEMGMSNKHELEKLTEIAPLDIALINNIGTNHIGNFQSAIELAEAKAEIFLKLKPSSVAVLTRNDQHYDFLLEYASKRNNNGHNNINNIVSFGSSSTAKVRLVNYVIEPSLNSSNSCAKVTVEIAKKFYCYTLPYYGEHFIINSLAAISVLVALKLTLKEEILISAFSCFKPEAGRGRQRRLIINGHNYPHKAILIDDCYNASFESIAALLNYLHSLRGRKLLILGDILEAGANIEKFYDSLGTKISKLSSENNNKQAEEGELECLILIGNNISYLHKKLIITPQSFPGPIYYYKTVKELIENFYEIFQEFINWNNKENNKEKEEKVEEEIIIAVKGSNGVGLKKFIKYLLTLSKISERGSS